MLGGPIGDYATEQQDHARLRRLLTPAFSARRMDAMRHHIQHLTDQLLDRIAALPHPVDLHHSLAVPLPVLVICEMLGVPAADRDQVAAWSEALGIVDEAETSATAMAEFMRYADGLIEERRRHPGDDVISELVGAEPDNDLISLAVTALLFAGHETTTTRIDVGALLLMRHPEQRAAFQADPDRIPAAVEEILRFGATDESPLTRYARTDIEIGGVRIRAGEAVMISAIAANRDPAAFADPDTFDTTRRPNQHLTFGHGKHFCMGAGLARTELQIALGSLLTRFPTIGLAVAPERLRIRHNAITGGLAELPVTW
jgi:pentalenolactone synthase